MCVSVCVCVVNRGRQNKEHNKQKAGSRLRWKAKSREQHEPCRNITQELGLVKVVMLYIPSMMNDMCCRTTKLLISTVTESTIYNLENRVLVVLATIHIRDKHTVLSKVFAEIGQN